MSRRRIAVIPLTVDADVVPVVRAVCVRLTLDYHVLDAGSVVECLGRICDRVAGARAVDEAVVSRSRLRGDIRFLRVVDVVAAPVADLQRDLHVAHAGLGNLLQDLQRRCLYNLGFDVGRRLLFERYRDLSRRRVAGEIRRSISDRVLARRVDVHRGVVYREGRVLVVVVRDRDAVLISDRVVAVSFDVLGALDHGRGRVLGYRERNGDGRHVAALIRQHRIESQLSAAADIRLSCPLDRDAGSIGYARDAVSRRRDLVHREHGLGDRLRGRSRRIHDVQRARVVPVIHRYREVDILGYGIIYRREIKIAGHHVREGRVLGEEIPERHRVCNFRRDLELDLVCFVREEREKLIDHHYGYGREEEQHEGDHAGSVLLCLGSGGFPCFRFGRRCLTHGLPPGR